MEFETGLDLPIAFPGIGCAIGKVANDVALGGEHVVAEAIQVAIGELEVPGVGRQCHHRQAVMSANDVGMRDGVTIGGSQYHCSNHGGLREFDGSVIGRRSSERFCSVHGVADQIFLAGRDQFQDDRFVEYPSADTEDRGLDEWFGRVGDEIVIRSSGRGFTGVEDVVGLQVIESMPHRAVGNERAGIETIHDLQERIAEDHRFIAVAQFEVRMRFSFGDFGACLA